MGLMDSLKNKVSRLAERHEAKIDQGLDKAARMADSTTKGKYSTKIHSGTGKAKGAVGKIAHKERDD